MKSVAEFNDIYDEKRVKTGRVHKRGTTWKKGDYGLTVCVWVYDGRGRLLLTRRAREKSYPGTWENSGGAVKAGEDSLHGIQRELYEETGIFAELQEFELIDQGKDNYMHYDFYCVKKDTPLSKIKLLPGETDGVRWADFRQVHTLVESGEICDIIGKQFIKQEPLLLMRNISKV